MCINYLKRIVFNALFRDRSRPSPIFDFEEVEKSKLANRPKWYQIGQQNHQKKDR